MEAFELQKILMAFLTPLGLALSLILLGLLRRQRALIALALAALWLLSTPAVVQQIAHGLSADRYHSTVDHAPSADVILVLGGTLSAGNGTRLVHNLNGAADRLIEAAELYRAGKAPILLFSGGPVDAWGDSEADGAARLWQRLGVPAEAIVLERESRTTRENAAFSLPKLKALQARRVLLVTSAWHLRRALRNVSDAAEAEGLVIEWLPHPCDPVELIEDQDPWLRWLPNSTALETSQKLSKELLGLAWATLGGD